MFPFLRETSLWFSIVIAKKRRNLSFCAEIFPVVQTFCVSEKVQDGRGVKGGDLFMGEEIMGWPKTSFGFFCKMLWKNLNEHFDQPNRSEREIESLFQVQLVVSKHHDFISNLVFLALSICQAKKFENCPHPCCCCC